MKSVFAPDVALAVEANPRGGQSVVGNKSKRLEATQGTG